MSTLVVYGAYGYTGELVARRAVEQGLRPVLLGRREAPLAALAEELGLPHQSLSLEDPTTLRGALTDASCVLHCAGPFSHTSAPMVEACLETGTHYLDITGEIAVFEAAARRDDDAQRAGVMLLPGAGFDVVPSDCLAAHLHRRLPSATHLDLVFHAIGRVSRGTATTMVENLPHGGAIRRDGKIVRVPTAWKTRTVDLGRGPKTAVTIPWGDVSTAYHSTGIPNTTVSTVVPRRSVRGMKLSRHLGPLLGTNFVQSFLKRRIDARPPGPDEGQRERGEAILQGEVRDALGRYAAARLRTPEGYELTAIAAVEIARRVLGGDAQPGFMTPSKAYGADFVLELDGVERTEL